MVVWCVAGLPLLAAMAWGFTYLRARSSLEGLYQWYGDHLMFRSSGGFEGYTVREAAAHFRKQPEIFEPFILQDLRARDGAWLSENMSLLWTRLVLRKTRLDPASYRRSRGLQAVVLWPHPSDRVLRAVTNLFNGGDVRVSHQALKAAAHVAAEADIIQPSLIEGVCDPDFFTPGTKWGDNDQVHLQMAAYQSLSNSVTFPVSMPDRLIEALAEDRLHMWMYPRLIDLLLRVSPDSGPHAAEVLRSKIMRDPSGRPAEWPRRALRYLEETLGKRTRLDQSAGQPGGEASLSRDASAQAITTE